MRKDCTLENALDYNNEDVIFRFIKIFNISDKQAILIFEETKKWLWLCYKATEPSSNIPVMIDDSMLIIDEMWHNFILFTKDYEKYCFEKFGFYMHHQPTSKSEYLEWGKDIKKNNEVYLKTIKKQYSYIFDLFGKETLLLWYKEFAKEYSKEKIKELMR